MSCFQKNNKDGFKSREKTCNIIKNKKNSNVNEPKLGVSVSKILSTAANVCFAQENKCKQMLKCKGFKEIAVAAMLKELNQIDNSVEPNKLVVALINLDELSSDEIK